MSVAVSVVIPTRDRPEALATTLRAAAAQRGVAHEIVLVDDGSSSPAVSDVAERFDAVRYIRNEAPLGVAGARNRGIAESRGDWVAFLDDDDVWSPDKLAAQLRAAEDAGAAWAYTGDVNVDDDLHVLSGGPPPDPDEVLARLPRYNPLSSGASNVVVRAELLTAVGGFDVELRRTEDWDLWIRLARTGPPACVRRPLVAYRFHTRNILDDDEAIVTEPRRLAARHGIPVDLAAMHRRAAWSALRAGRRAHALRHYAAAVVRGDVRSIGRAAVGLTFRGVGTDRLFDLLPSDAAWIREAEAWLAPFARTASGSAHR